MANETLACKDCIHSYVPWDSRIMYTIFSFGKIPRMEYRCVKFTTNKPPEPDPVTGPEKFTPEYERCYSLRGYNGACKGGIHWAPKHKKDLFKALTKKEVGEE